MIIGNLRPLRTWPLLLAALCLAASPAVSAEFPLAITMLPQGRVQLGWEAGGPEGARFEVYRRHGDGPEARLDGANLHPHRVGEGAARRFSALYWDDTARRGTAYTYRVVMVGPGGERLGGSPQTVFMPHDLRPPARVEGLTAQSTERTVSLSWKPVDDPEVIGFRVYRRAVPLPRKADPDPASRGVLLAEPGPGASSHTDEGVAPQTLYYYRVAAVDAHDGEGELSVPALAALPDADPPEPPRSLDVAGEVDGRVRLRWAASPSPDVTLYVVHRGVGVEGEPVPVLRVPAQGAGPHEAEDRVSPGSAYVYAYAVTAVDGGGNESPATAPSELRLPDRTPPAAPVLTELAVKPGAVRLSWSPPADEDVAGYNVYRAETKGGAPPVRLNADPVRETGYEDATARGGVVYGYEVRAVDRDGNEGGPSAARSQRAYAPVRTEAPGPPEVREEKGALCVSWGPLESPDLEGYLVDRGPTADGPFEQVSGLVTDPTFSDPGAEAREAVWYRVRAFYRGGRTSEPSEAVEWRAMPGPAGKGAQ